MLDCLASYGVVGDGLKNDTSALQNAVDDCASSGGGKITLQGGKTYLVGTLTLKSHIEIHFEAGSILKATPNSSDFNVSFGGVALNDSNLEHGDTEKPTVMLNAENAENISITGTGTLDGSGRDYILKDRGSIYEMSLRRPFTIYFRSCNSITFRDVRIIDGALWTLRLSVCEDVVISGVRIHNDVKIPNSDAIDLDCCRRVRISDCDLVAGDDAICLKACLEHTRDSKERVCEDVTITGCTITTTSAAIKVGTECQTAIRNVTISSCIVHNSSRGLCIRLAEGGHIANILCTNIILQSSFPDQLWCRVQKVWEPFRTCVSGIFCADPRMECLSTRNSQVLFRGLSWITFALKLIDGVDGKVALQICGLARVIRSGKCQPMPFILRMQIVLSSATVKLYGQ